MYPRQVQRCLEMQKQTRFDDAIACYTEVLRYSEGNKLSLDDRGAALIYNNRGLAYASKGLYNQGISDFEKAIQLDPSLNVAVENLKHFKKKAK
jgi:tetratricopeptide (TPR) repeat protein